MNKVYYIVTNQKIIDLFKQSRYFKVNLGMAITQDKNGERVISDKDTFAVSYNYQYKTHIMAKGMVGNIRFYLDHGINNNDNIIAGYYELEEFIFELDTDFINEKGIDAYLGHILMAIDDKYKSQMDEQKKAYQESKAKVGNPDILKANPGAVTYEDIKEYLKKKNLG